jgi:DNA-binding response OmpR family regulator
MVEQWGTKSSNSYGTNGCRATDETILLVEDEALVRKAMAEVLEQAGYRLTVAASAAQALATQRDTAEPFHLLLADIVLPAVSGHELAAQLSLQCPQTRVLLMSGYFEKSKSCESGFQFDGCLAKPFSIRTLLRRVRAVLDKNHPCQSLVSSL